jgi:hypothetical protein
MKEIEIILKLGKTMGLIVNHCLKINSISNFLEIERRDNGLRPLTSAFKLHEQFTKIWIT